MPSEIREEVYKRIVLSKALHKAGEYACSNKNDPFEFTKGILLLHDAAEAILGALADHLHSSFSGNPFLLSYYDLIKQADPEHRDVPYKTQMRNLNTLRNNAKHQGILPDPKSNIHMPNIVYSLSNEICSNYLGLDFMTISLKSLIRDKNIFSYIDAAEKKIQDGTIDQALISLAFAMYYICEQSTIPSITSQSESKGDSSHQFTDPHALHHAVTLLEHGIDVYNYYRFKNLTPLIGKENETGKLFYWWDKTYGHAGNWTLENAYYCLHFCIEVALKFQRDEYEGFTLLPYFLFFEDTIEPSGNEAIIWNSSLYHAQIPERQHIAKIPLLTLEKGQSIVGMAFDFKNRLEEWCIISKNIPSETGEMFGVGYALKKDVMITPRKTERGEA